MKLHVPLTMPSRASTRLAISPRCSASMIGIPPPAEASKAMQVFLSRASLNSSPPLAATAVKDADPLNIHSFHLALSPRVEDHLLDQIFVTPA